MEAKKYSSLTNTDNNVKSVVKKSKIVLTVKRSEVEMLQQDVIGMIVLILMTVVVGVVYYFIRKQNRT